MSVKIAEINRKISINDKTYPIIYKAWQDSNTSYRITEQNGFTTKAYVFGSFDSLNETWESIKNMKEWGMV